MTHYSGEQYIWTLHQTAIAAAMYPAALTHPPSWIGIEGLMNRVAMAGQPLPDSGPKNVPWARAAFADAESRFNWKYEKVVA